MLISPPPTSSSFSFVSSKIEKKEDSPDCPDGDLLACMQVLVAILANMLVWGCPSAFGVYQLYYVGTMRAALIPSLWTMTVGCGTVVFGTFITSLCGRGGEPRESNKYSQISLAEGICTWFGLGIYFIPPLSVVILYFGMEKWSVVLVLLVIGIGL
ncbi:hypothetical protein NEUTE1DRAFT_134834 [Neurospora tetrasperma FGSC 2508]|uniref:Uncharacterized protein n=1 Tax=Neurospora tetrasperma (strain FGSC 2508 / ATCC MYA-4615 / P0657) TaxID=510951 RepID=F8MER6_NEUT8|nr:uncharacterized protein NEUTE1DRAFT_134834 [Neurospora tetrasperma FGSC 2508]EGO60840.1 hypothetical protein NEUTE1DRAFT_134834 [Neurospora tetrasperma FGSC 2508]EGZ75169.1 hypothetical protein NEUTE2DRAFT_164078 [Neurospora tetrasperma FGSC 2509]